MATGNIAQQTMEIGNIPSTDMETGDIPTTDMETGNIPLMDMETGHIPLTDIETGHIPSMDLETDNIPSRHMEIGHISSIDVEMTVASSDKDTCTDPHHLQSVTSSATTHKFLRAALKSDQASVVSLLKKSTVNLSVFVQHLCKRKTDHLLLFKLCILVVEADMLDTLKEIIVCVYQFDSCSESGLMTYERLYNIYEKIVEKCEDKVSEVLEAVRKDPRYCCQYLAVFLAAHLKKWKLALKIMRTQCVTLLRGSDKVFVQAVSCEAWACAVQVLHNILLVRDISYTVVLDRIKERVRNYKFIIAENDNKLLECFVEHSKHRKMYAAGAMFTAWGRRWGLVQEFLKQLHEDPHNNANFVLLRELLENCKLQMVYSWLLKLSRQGPLQPDYVDVVLWMVVDNCRNGGASTLVNWLMDKCKDKPLLTQILYHIILCCQPDLLRKFIAKDLLLRCEDLDYAFRCALDIFITSRNDDGTIVDTETSNCCYQVIVMCIEAGFSCQVNDISDTLYAASVRSGLNKPLVQLLHHSGFVSSTGLHRMLLHLDMESYSREEYDKEEFRKLLKSLTDTPRTLKNLCCLCLSGIIGCGANRKERALALGLPLKVTNQVLFQDVLYSELGEQAAMSGPQ